MKNYDQQLFDAGVFLTCFSDRANKQHFVITHFCEFPHSVLANSAADFQLTCKWTRCRSA